MSSFPDPSVRPPMNDTNFVHSDARPGYLTVGLLYRHWFVIFLSILIFIDYVILWARLPAVYSLMIAGTLPFSMAFLYAIHRIIRDPRVEKTLGLKMFFVVIVIYLISMMYFAIQIPKQKCTDV